MGNSVGPRHGNCEDPKFVKNSDCDCANAPESCYNYAQNTRADEYLESHGYSSSTSVAKFLPVTMDLVPSTLSTMLFQGLSHSTLSMKMTISPTTTNTSKVSTP